MKSDSSCIPCFLVQAHSSALAASDDEAQRQEVLKQAAAMIPELDLSRSPAYNSSLILHKVKELLGVDDPFAADKKKYNDLALSMLNDLRGMVKSSEDQLDMAIKLSVVGNVIDLGIKHDPDIEGTIEQALGEGFAIYDIDLFKEKLGSAKRLLYLLDNAGEIVFDMLLIETLRRQGKAVIAVVKSGPIINDATMEDANQVGLSKICKVVETGHNYVGVERDLVLPVIVKALDSAELIIAKGQGNYETLEGASDRMFFILKAKCQCVADQLGVNVGDLVFKCKG